MGQLNKMSSSSQHPALIQVLASSVAIADKAGDIVRNVFSQGKLGIVEKEGPNDLQTQADRSAQDCILASLLTQFPNLKVVGEEGELDMSSVKDDMIVRNSDAEVLELTCPTQWSSVSMEQLTVWVDPLDGTKEYTQGLLDHVTVLIGIAVGTEAVAGVIHQPYYNYKSQEPGAQLGRTFYGLVGGGVYGLTRVLPPSDKKIVTTTQSHPLNGRRSHSLCVSVSGLQKMGHLCTRGHFECNGRTIDRYSWCQISIQLRCPTSKHGRGLSNCQTGRSPMVCRPTTKVPKRRS